MDTERHLDIRKPLDDLEAAWVRQIVARPDAVQPDVVAAVRYVLSFSRMTLVRNEAGVDVDLSSQLAAHRWRVLEALRPHLEESPDLGGVVRALPALVSATRTERTKVLENQEIDRDSLEAEVTTRSLVVVAGGGGGSGYGYAGAYTLFYRHGLQPELVAGTSMGALMGLFRARTRIFDFAPMVAAAERLSWQSVFRMLTMDSRYGVPAALRLYLRAAIGDLFHTPDGQPMTFADLELPMLVVATGITVDALKHDLDWYEHFLDDFVGPGRVGKRTRLAGFGRMASIFKDLMSTPDALQEIVFGADEATQAADVIDAVGFSSAIPGIIHYDIYREDEAMRKLLDQLYGQYGITRLLEGGVVNNLPCRPAYAEVMKGRLGRRNALIFALDCFSPQARKPLFYPVQQLVRGNVSKNIPYAHHVFNMDRRLNPLNLVPDLDSINDAMNWTIDEMAGEMPWLETMCCPLPVLQDET